MKKTNQIKLAVDAIVFGYNKPEGMSVLLIKRKYEPLKGSWALPGGFVKHGESLELAVERELKEETGISINYLEQLYTFGEPTRDLRNHIVSIAYFGLVKTSNFKKLASTNDAETAQWFHIDSVPKLAFDHNQILAKAVERLQTKIRYQPIGFELLNKEFPFSDLEHLYSSVLNQPVDRRNFKKKFIKLGILDQLDKKVKLKGAGRPGNLFRFNKSSYDKLLKRGFHFEI